MEHLTDLLWDHDVRGSRGCLVSDDCNLIFAEVGEFNGHASKVDLLSPAGLSASMVLSGKFFQQPMEIWDEAILIWDSRNKKAFDNLTRLNLKVDHFWLFHGLDQWNPIDSAIPTYQVGKHSDIIPVRRFKDENSLRVLELFCGAYGGWKSGFQFLRDHFDLRVQVIGLDNDLEAILNYSATYKTNLINGMEQLSWDFFYDKCDSFALHADIRSTKWLPAIGMWGPDVVTVSAPCPSWSEASKSAGLGSELGKLFLKP